MTLYRLTKVRFKNLIIGAGTISLGFILMICIFSVKSELLLPVLCYTFAFLLQTPMIICKNKHTKSSKYSAHISIPYIEVPFSCNKSRQPSNFIKCKKWQISFQNLPFFSLVRIKGFEPPRCYSHGPEPCASANSAIFAYPNLFTYAVLHHILQL